MLCHRRSMKRRATNVRVTKRAADQIKLASGSSGDGNATGGMQNATGATGGGVGGGGGQQEQEYTGVVSLVQLDRHFGFIDMLGLDERVFFHLSEVVADGGGETPGGVGSGAVTDSRGKEDGAGDNSAGGIGGGGDGVGGDGAGADGAGAGGGGVGDGVKGGRGMMKKGQEVLIKKGQEVAFRLGQRQGRPLGLRVRKLKSGTLPTEVLLPSRFVGVVVVAPRNVSGADSEKVSYTMVYDVDAG